MGSTVAAILTVATLTVWHLRTRRHPCWSTSPSGRFYITAGYPAVAIAVFWLVDASIRATTTTTVGWEWAIGNLWALVAMVSFVYGFNALHCACEKQRQAAQAIESIDSTGDEARSPSNEDSNGGTFA